MSKKRRQHSPEFKAKIALELLRGDKTAAEIAEQYDLSPVLISQWKSKLVDQSETIFERGNSKKDDSEAQIKELYTRIGQLEMERDFLSKAFEPWKNR